MTTSRQVWMEASVETDWRAPLDQQAEVRVRLTDARTNIEHSWFTIKAANLGDLLTGGKILVDLKEFRHDTDPEQQRRR